MAGRPKSQINASGGGGGETVLELLGGEASQAERLDRERYASAPEGFIRWCEEKTYILDKESNKWKPFQFEPWQLSEVRRVFTGKWLTIVLSWPRRHGKSEISARYDLWRCRYYEFQTIIIGSNSQDQSLSTAYTIAEETIRNSPALKAELNAGEITIGTDEIFFARTNSRITGITTSERSAYGKKVNVGHITELCKAIDDSLYQVIASSTGDAHKGVMICDSNVGSVDNMVWKLIKLAESGEDPTIGVSYISYRDLGEAVAKRPRWITEPWLRARARQLTPGEFRRNHLNVPATAGEKLFTEAQVSRCINLSLPLVQTAETFQQLRQRYYAGILYRGGGLDRALSFSKNGDRTFWAVVVKGLLSGVQATEEPVYDESGQVVDSILVDPWDYNLVELKLIPYSDPTQIKQSVESSINRFGGLDNVSYEQYQAGDIYLWSQAASITSELTHATAPVQLQQFNEYFRLVASGRFHMANHPLARAEMLNLEEDSSGRLPSFGGPRARVQLPDGSWERIKDDTQYAIINAIWALRECISVPQGPPVAVPSQGRS